MKDLLTAAEVANKLGVSPRTVTYWCNEKKHLLPNAFQIEVATGTGKVWLIPASDLDGFEKPGAPGVGRPRKNSGQTDAT